MKRTSQEKAWREKPCLRCSKPERMDDRYYCRRCAWDRHNEAQPLDTPIAAHLGTDGKWRPGE